MSLNDWAMQQEWQSDYEKVAKVDAISQAHGCNKSVYDYIRGWKHILGCEVMYEGDIFYITAIDEYSMNENNPVVHIMNADKTVGYKIFADRLKFFNGLDVPLTFKTYVETYWPLR